MDKKFSLSLTGDEYRAVLRRRIEESLRAAAIPAEVVSELLTAFNHDGGGQTEGGGKTAQTAQEASHPAAAPFAQPRADQRTKAHWLTQGIKPVENPHRVSDLIVNALFKGCHTVPELAKATRKPRKAIYTALWALKRDGVIDKGEPPHE